MIRSLAAMTDSVIQQMEGGFSTDDSRLNYDLVRDKILRVSWEQIAKYYGKWVGQLPDVLYQRCCIDLACQEVCGSGVYRKTGQLPGMMGLVNGREIRFVGTVQGKPFERTTRRGKRWELYQPFSGKASPSYRIVGETLEVIDAPLGLEVVEVEGIFTDPTACKLCVEDDQFILPLSGELLNTVEVQVMKELAQVWMQRTIDKANNATPNA